MDTTLADRLRIARKQKKLTQAAASKQVGVSRQTWISWEDGAQPTLDRLPAIARALGVDLDYLVGAP